MRFYWDVFRLSYAGHTFLSVCLAFDHACCLPPERQTERLAVCCVPIPPWVEIAIRAFSRRWCGYLPWRVHFGFVRLFVAIPTEDEGDEETRGNGRDGERSRRWVVSALLRDRIGFAVFSAGSTLGLRAPNLRQRVFDSLDSLHLVRGVDALYAARGTRV